MADNTTLPGTGNVIAADDIGGVLFQRVKLIHGADGVNAGDVAAANPLPVSVASLPLPAGAATETTLAALNTKVTAVNTGAVVLAAGSAIAGKFGIDQTTPGTTNAVAIATVGGTNVNASPVGFQRVTDEPRTVFYDPFESLDTTDRWTITSAGGGVAPAVAVGRLTLGSGTTINGYAYATSQPTFLPSVPGWLGYSFVIKLESAVGINAVRFWGMGLVSGSVPSSTNPLGTTGNGMGFEVDIAGVLRAVMYSNGVRTVINALASNQPADANDHRYIIAYRTDRTDFYIDGLGATQLVATAAFQSPSIQVLSCLLRGLGNVRHVLHVDQMQARARAAHDGKREHQCGVADR